MRRPGIPSLLYVVLLFSGFQVLRARAAVPEPKMEFRQLGEILPDGTQVGVVIRRKGAETTFRCMSMKGGRLTVPLPPEDGHGRIATCFLIVGLTSQDLFAGFLDHPERWSWTSVAVSLTGGVSAGGRFHPKGATPQ